MSRRTGTAFFHYMRLMMREEFRLQTTFSSKLGFLSFPVLLTIFAFVLAAASSVLFQNIAAGTILLILHGSMTLYGISTGAFGVIGEQILERRFGQINLLLSAPVLLPIRLKKAILAFYIKDIIYYLVLSIAPLGIGLIGSVPLSGFGITRVLLLLGTLILSFLVGISLCFFVSTLYARWKWVGGTIAGVLFLLTLGSLFLNWIPLRWLLPALHFETTGDGRFLILALIQIAAFSALAVALTKKRVEPKSATSQPSTLPAATDRFTGFGSYGPLIAKEFVDLKRSGTISPIIFSFAGPLIFLSLIIWFLDSALQFAVSFNLVFYAAMIGFLGMMIYSWLNNVDNVEFYGSLPISVPQVIRAKFIVYLILTAGITVAYLVVLGFVNAELALLPLALLVAFATSLYVVIATAYLTGLRTNTYLFDATILAKFSAMTVLPLVAVTILSLMMTSLFFIATLLIVGVSIALAFLTLLLHRRIDRRWGREDFVVS